MLEDGLYERFGVPDYALAFHVSAGDPAGKVEVRGGLIASSSDSVDIVVHGIGAHGASPHKGKDPIYIGAQIVDRAPGTGQPRAAAVAAGRRHGRLRSTPASSTTSSRRGATLQLTVRSNDEETCARRCSTASAESPRASAAPTGLPDELLPEVILSTESTPTTINDDALAERVRSAFAARASARTSLYESDYEGMGAEDFAYFVQTEQKVPGCYFTVGGTPQAELDAEDERRTGGGIAPLAVFQDRAASRP